MFKKKDWQKKGKEMIKMSVNVILLGVIIIYGILGMTKGGIRSIGGLISTIVSGILSKVLALPVTEFLFDKFCIGEKIAAYVQSTSSSVLSGGGTINDCITEFSSLVNTGSIDLNSPFEKVVNILSNSLNHSILQISSVFVMIILFTVFMLIFGLVIKCFEDTFKHIPLGKTLNSIIGIGCGLLKGIIISIIICVAIYYLNYIPGVNIPLDTSAFNNIITLIRGNVL